MKKLTLNATKRKKGDSTKQIRADRKVPAVVYGKNQEPISLTLDASDMLRMYRDAGESHIINLMVGKEDIEVLVHQTQKDPVQGDFIHVDFYALTRGEKLTTKIHLEFEGNSEAVKEGAILNENVKEIEVSCLPRDLVDCFKVDITPLKEFDDVIRLSDLNIDEEKYEIHNLHPEDAIIVAGKPAKVEDLDAPIEDPGLPEGAEEAGEEGGEDADGDEEKKEEETQK